MKETPYLSLIVTARNDDHGGNLLERMQIFVSGWLAQARRHHLASELVIVEWNPLPGRPSLRDALSWPDDCDPCQVRFIEVSAELHGCYAHAEALPLYQMIAKNVGLRRARGEFLLATNIDILFSDELMAFLGRRELKRGRMYRIDRHDVMSDVPAETGIEEQLAWCQSHLLRVNAAEGTFPLTPDGQRKLSETDIAPLDSGLSLGQGWYPVERYAGQEGFRWIQNDAVIQLSAPPAGLELCLEMEPGPGMGQRPALLEIFDNERPLSSFTIDRRSEVAIRVSLEGPLPRRLRLHIHGGGCRCDFDVRELNLRVFSCRWSGSRPRSAPTKFETVDSENTKSGPTKHPIVTSITPQPWHRRLALGWEQLQHLITRMAYSGPLLQVTVPVSMPLQRASRFYVESEGITGFLRHPFAKGSRRVTMTEPVPAVPASQATELLTEPPASQAEVSSAPHTNGCGDFTLLARENWFDLRGYPEFDVFSMNVDSIFCFAAHFGGFREEILRDPMRIYHIEHGTGSGWTPEGQAKLFERIAAKGIPHIPSSEVIGWAVQMRRLQCPIIFNHEDWGLADVNLPETQVGGGSSGIGESSISSQAAPSETRR